MQEKNKKMNKRLSFRNSNVIFNDSLGQEADSREDYFVQHLARVGSSIGTTSRNARAKRVLYWGSRKAQTAARAFAAKFAADKKSVIYNRAALTRRYARYV